MMPGACFLHVTPDQPKVDPDSRISEEDLDALVEFDISGWLASPLWRAPLVPAALPLRLLPCGIRLRRRLSRLSGRGSSLYWASLLPSRVRFPTI